MVFADCVWGSQFPFSWVNKYITLPIKHCQCLMDTVNLKRPNFATTIALVLKTNATLHFDVLNCTWPVALNLAEFFVKYIQNTFLIVGKCTYICMYIFLLLSGGAFYKRWEKTTVMQTKIDPSWNVKLKYHKKWFLPLSTTISGEGKAIAFLQVSIKEQGPSYFLTPQGTFVSQTTIWETFLAKGPLILQWS